MQSSNGLHKNPLGTFLEQPYRSMLGSDCVCSWRILFHVDLVSIYSRFV